MVELFEQNIKTVNRQSSKGNQMKWLNGTKWYKADYTGYEGLVEYVVSSLLESTSLKKTEFVEYTTEEIKYKYTNYRGCRSENFLPEGWSLITLERLFYMRYNQSLTKSIYEIADYENRIQFLVNQTIRMTGLQEFGAYMSKMLTIDAFFLNEDRHMHNIAVLLDDVGEFHYCPFFDHGASLLADTTMDYPIGENIDKLIKNVEARTICRDFDEQLDIVEQIYGRHISFNFSDSDILELLKAEPYYGEEIKNRVMQVLLQQKRKYQYLIC